MSSEPIYPDGFSPDRPEAELRAAAASRLGFSCASLAMKYESLGDDCEFGFVQRRFGAEPLSLFRFSNPKHDIILRAVRDDFAGFGDSASVVLDNQSPRREWIVVDPVNGLRQHTFVWEGNQDEKVVQKDQLLRFRFLRRMIVENIAEGNKIFVIKSGTHDLTEAVVRDIAAALRVKGPSWLLWVEPGREVGRVEQLADGLLRGTIDYLTVQPHVRQFVRHSYRPDATELSFAGWLAVLTTAWQYAEPLLPPDSPLREDALLRSS